jgi:hypothetical protein
MHVRAAACAAVGLELPPISALRELLHDAEEGLLGFDCVSPLKPFMGEAFKTLTVKLEAAVFLRYALPRWTQKEHAAHKLADRLAAASEAVHVAGWSAQEVKQTLKITVPPLSDDPLQAIYGGTAWEPWPPALAADRFLAELARLKTLCI